MKKLDRADLFEVVMSRLRIYKRKPSWLGEPSHGEEHQSEPVIQAGMRLLIARDRRDSEVSKSIRRGIINELTRLGRGMRRKEIDRLLNRLIDESTIRTPSEEERMADAIDLPLLWQLLADEHLVDDRFRPAVRTSQFESWREHTRATDEDLIPLWALANVPNGNIRNQIELLQCLKEWPTFLRADQPQLHHELSKGISCLHLHLSACYPAPYLWVALMNDRIDVQKIFAEWSKPHSDELAVDDILGEPDREEFEKYLYLTRLVRWTLAEKLPQLCSMEGTQDKDPSAALRSAWELLSVKGCASAPAVWGGIKSKVSARLKASGGIDYLHGIVDNAHARCPTLIGERWLNYMALSLIAQRRRQMQSPDGSPNAPPDAFFEELYWFYLEVKNILLNHLQQGSMLPNWEGFRFALSRNVWRSSTGLEVMAREIGNFLQESGSVVKIEFMISPPTIPLVAQETPPGKAAEGTDNLYLEKTQLEEIVKSYSETAKIIAGIRRTMNGRLHERLKIQYPNVQAGMIIHFLKGMGETLGKRRVIEAEDTVAYRIYHHTLRDRVMLDLSGILHYLESIDEKPDIPILAIDCANTEEYCPPEVFAQVYREATRNFRLHTHPRKVVGNRRTYHVGEVFPYLATGLRRIFEALEFLDLRAGDRIGHACALGLDPVAYLRSNPTVELSLIDQLDDAVFEWHLLTKYDPSDDARINRLERLIAERSEEIFGESLPPSTLCHSWLLRGRDTHHVEIQQELIHATPIPVWVRRQGKKLAEIKKARATSAPNGSRRRTIGTHAFFHSLLDLQSTEAGNEGNVPERESVPSDLAERICLEYQYDCTTIENFLRLERLNVSDQAPNLERIQRIMRRFVSERGVVIESNPTSNWLICGCERMSDVPAVQWETRYPGELAITINPDDPNVFSTSIENEYFFMFSALQQPPASLSRSEALECIRRLRTNALEASFLE